MIEALIGFATVVMVHAVASRLPPPRQSVPKVVLIGGVVGLGLISWLVQSYGLTIMMWAGLLLYAMLCELYIFSFTMTMSSVSVRLLVLLRQGPISVSEYTSEV